MASPIDQPGSTVPIETLPIETVPPDTVPAEPDRVRLEPVASWVRLEPVRFQRELLAGCWWPGTNDLELELGVLVPVLDRARGPVAKLLLSPAYWTRRPHDVVAAGRTITVVYLAAQSPALMTVVCADGASFTMRIADTRPVSDAPNGTRKGMGDDADGAVRPLHGQAIR
jgi:hypothetical protein